MTTSSVTLSKFARGLTTETAFDVLAVAQRLKAQGKDVVSLQIGDSPFPTTREARMPAFEPSKPMRPITALRSACPRFGKQSLRITVPSSASK